MIGAKPSVIVVMKAPARRDGGEDSRQCPGGRNLPFAVDALHGADRKEGEHDLDAAMRRFAFFTH
jgi:hypothetical protein